MNSIHKEGKSYVAYPPTEEAGKETAPFLNWNGSCPKGRSLSSIQFWWFAFVCQVMKCSFQLSSGAGIFLRNSDVSRWKRHALPGVRNATISALKELGMSNERPLGLGFRESRATPTSALKKTHQNKFFRPPFHSLCHQLFQTPNLNLKLTPGLQVGYNVESCAWWPERSLWSSTRSKYRNFVSVSRRGNLIGQFYWGSEGERGVLVVLLRLWLLDTVVSIYIYNGTSNLPSTYTIRDIRPSSSSHNWELLPRSLTVI